MITEEERSVADLRSIVSDMGMRVSKLNSILGMKEEPSEQNLPLIARERSLAETYKHLSLIVSSRMDRFKSLVAEHQRLCNSLGEPPKNYTFEYVPSLQLLGTIERDINELLIKLAKQYAETCNHKTSKQLIESDTTTTTATKRGDYTLSSDTYNGDSFTTSTSHFLRLQKRVSSIRESSKVDKLKASIISSLTELHKLFDECLVESSVRKRFPMDPSEGSVNETYLEYLDNQIKNWQDYRTLHTDVIAAFYSWRASFVRLLQVEEQLNESKQMRARGKGVRKLEIEATSIRERILPQLETLLFSAARKSGDFKVFGYPVKAYVEETKSEADRALPGVQRLTREKQAQLLGKSVSAVLPGSVDRARSSSRKSRYKANQSAKPGNSALRSSSGGPTLRPAGHSRYKEVILDQNQSASSMNSNVTRTPVTQKIEWPKSENRVGKEVPPIAATPTQLRTPRVAMKTPKRIPILSASCSRLYQKTPRAIQLLTESPRPVSVLDLFGPNDRTSRLRNAARPEKNGISGDSPSSNSSSQKNDLTPPLSSSSPPTSVKSDSVFATPLGRAPVARKKESLSRNISASCNRLNQMKSLTTSSISEVDVFEHQDLDENDITLTSNNVSFEGRGQTTPLMKTPIKYTMDSSFNKATPSQVQTPSSSSLSFILTNSQSGSLNSLKQKSNSATPINRGLVTPKLPKMHEHRMTPSTPGATAQSRIRAPRVMVTPAKSTPILSTSCSRLNRQQTPRALQLLQKSSRPLSVLELFHSDSGDRHDN